MHPSYEWDTESVLWNEMSQGPQDPVAACWEATVRKRSVVQVRCWQLLLVSKLEAQVGSWKLLTCLPFGRTILGTEARTLMNEFLLTTLYLTPHSKFSKENHKLEQVLRNPSLFKIQVKCVSFVNTGLGSQVQLSSCLAPHGYVLYLNSTVFGKPPNNHHHDCSDEPDRFGQS